MLVILTSHPIQYQAPLWRALAHDGRVPFEVWFLTDHAVKPTHDREFGKSFAWDSNLLDGYSYRFLPVRIGWQMDRFRGIHVSESWSKLFKEHGVTRLWVEGWRFSENWAAVCAARRAGVEVWMRGETNDLLHRSASLRETIRRFLLRQLFSRIHRFLCIGSANRRFYQSFGISSERLESAPYCVENRRFAEKAVDLRSRRLQIRRDWGIPDDKFCVLFCGKFIAKKRPMDLIAALGQLDGKRFHALFVGSGELESEMLAKIDPIYLHGKLRKVEEGPRPKASFAGFLNQSAIVEAYVAADCLVLASDFGETWGLVANEAMAAGLPCIASDQCGCAEDLVHPIFPEGIFKTGNFSQLAAAIQNLEKHPVPGEAIRSLIDRFSIRETVNTVATLSGSWP